MEQEHFERKFDVSVLLAKAKMVLVLQHLNPSFPVNEVDASGKQGIFAKPVTCIYIYPVQHLISRFCQSEWGSSLPDIPPGHRILISNFVRNVQKHLNIFKGKSVKSRVSKTNQKMVHIWYSVITASNGTTKDV